MKTAALNAAAVAVAATEEMIEITEDVIPASLRSETDSG